jgi:hypothetical protein
MREWMTSALVGGEWSASRTGRFTSAERAPDTHWVGGCVDRRIGLDEWRGEKPCSYCNYQLLWRLRYPGS